MDYFLTTYSKDFKWPVARSCADVTKFQNELKLREATIENASPCLKGHKGDETQGVEMAPAQSGAPPQGPASKYDQPNAYLRKLYMKYPYLYSVMRMGSPDEIVKKVMNEKYKTTYQIEYNKEDFHPSDDFTMVMDVVETADKIKREEKGKQTACAPGSEGSRPEDCKCAPGITLETCKCRREDPVRKIAWRPAPISKIPQAPREPKKDKGQDGSSPSPAKGSGLKLRPFVSEYSDTISRIGGIIIKRKLLYPKIDPFVQS